MSNLRVTTPPVTRTQIVRFAGAAGDFNPMHHDERFALAAGQPSVFAMGQLQAAILAAAVGDWLGRENVVAYGVRFREKVWPGDALVLTGTVVEERDGMLRCELQAARQADAVVVLSGWARARAVRPAQSGTSSSASAMRSS
jgi:acyl dehydratase